MPAHIRVRFAYFATAACAVASAVQLGVWFVTLPAPPAAAQVVNAAGWLLLLPLTFAGVAALIIARRPENRVGWLLLLPAVVSATELALPALPPAGGVISPGLWLRLWVDNWSWVLLIFPVFLIPLHFPTGRPPSPRWRWVNWLALGMWLFMMLGGAFSVTIGPVDDSWRVVNPLGFISDALFSGPFLLLWGGALLLMLGVSVSALFVRYRHAGSLVRQQIKWLLAAGAFFFVIYSLTYFLEGNAWTPGVWVDLALVLGMLTIPVAVGIAILRYRLYDIDLIIRRTLQYALLTGLLALVYFGSVVVLQTVTGRLLAEQSPLVIVLSTLLIAALFAPLRRRVQALVDRRFYRRKYDAARTLAAFGQTARDQTDVDALATELARVVAETMQPRTVGIWRRKERPRFRETP